MNVSVAELGLYPGKSMRPAEDVDKLVFDHNGLFGDRQYMWVEATTYGVKDTIIRPGHFLSQRQDPILTTMKPELIEEGVYIRGQDRGYSLYAPHQADVAKNWITATVWNWQGKAVDQGQVAAEWGSAQLGRPVRLVAVSETLPRYVNNDPALGRVGFADGYPLLVTSVASVESVNRQLISDGRLPVPANRFRPNIVLDGLEPFEEDYIEQLTLSVNGLALIMRRAKACSRCPIPDTDQITGERGVSVRAALGRLGRRGIHEGSSSGRPNLFLGQNFVVQPPETMLPGDVIELTRDTPLTANCSVTTNWIPASA